MHFLGKKVIVFCFKFYLKFFIPRVQLTVSQYWLGNCLTHWPPGRFQFNCRYVIFKLILLNGGWGISYGIAPRWIPLNLTDDKSTLVQLMAWCCQTTSHYLIQCWPSSIASLSHNELTGNKPLLEAMIDICMYTLLGLIELKQPGSLATILTHWLMGDVAAISS